jgi:hypothetical protein
VPFTKKIHPKRKVEIIANPRCISRIRGINNENIRNLKTRFKFDQIAVVPDPALSPAWFIH